jgi:hypothetical protein
MIPDLEPILVAHLKAATGARVVTRTPTDKTAGWVRITQLDGQGSYPDHLVDFLVQADCYGTAGTAGQAEASLLARQVREALADLPGVHGDAVVTGTRITGHARIPDTDGFEPARERYIVSASIFAHST